MTLTDYLLRSKGQQYIACRVFLKAGITGQKSHVRCPFLELPPSWNLLDQSLCAVLYSRCDSGDGVSCHPGIYFHLSTDALAS